MTDYSTQVTFKPLIAEMMGDGRGWDFTVIGADGAPVSRGGFSTEAAAREEMANVLKRLANGEHPLGITYRLKPKHRVNLIDRRLHPLLEGQKLANELLKHALRQAKTGAHRPRGTGGEALELEQQKTTPLAIGREFSALSVNLGNKAKAARIIGDKYRLTGSDKNVLKKLNLWAQGRIPAAG